MKSLAIPLVISLLLITARYTDARAYRVWKEDFERMDVGSQWKGSLDHPDLTRIIKTPSAEGHNTKALEIKYLKNKFGKESRVRYKVRLVKADVYVVEFHVKFKSGFDFKKGGKLPGICGGSCTTGCKNITADGWSSRFMWYGGNKLQLYIYDQDRNDGGKPHERYCGTLYDLNYDIKTGEWIKLRKEIRLNRPNQYDGSVRVWVNDKEIYSDIRRWRGATHKAQIDMFYFTTFYGGSTRSWAPSRDTFAYFDNFRVYQP